MKHGLAENSKKPARAAPVVASRNALAWSPREDVKSAAQGRRQRGNAATRRLRRRGTGGRGGGALCETCMAEVHFLSFQFQLVLIFECSLLLLSSSSLLLMMMMMLLLLLGLLLLFCYFYFYGHISISVVFSGGTLCETTDDEGGSVPSPRSRRPCELSLSARDVETSRRRECVCAREALSTQKYTNSVVVD